MAVAWVAGQMHMLATKPLSGKMEMQTLQSHP